MNWDGPNSYSYGVDAFLSRLSAHGQPEGERAFPERVDRALVRFQGDETVKQWFDRCVKAFMPEGLDRWQLEENLAAFAIVSWKEPIELRHVTINLIKTECSLQDYLDLSERDLETKEWQAFSKPRYLRLDLDYGTLGPIGTHPLPHFHISPDDPPRFALGGNYSTNIVVDFLDYVYRHYFPKEWQSWAAQTWNTHYKSRYPNPDVNLFDRIVAGFNESQFGAIRELDDEITELSYVLDQAKGQMYDLRMNGFDRGIMSFPNWPR